MPTSPALPAGTALGHSYEYGVDINIGTTASPIWQPVRRISDVQVTPTPKTQPAQTYDDFGADNNDVTGWTTNLSFAVQANRSTATGLYLPEVEAIRARVLPSAKGEAAVLEARWYHKPESGAPNPTDAGRGFFTVAIQRGAIGSDGATETLNVTLSGKGTATAIANPFQGWGAAAPTIATMAPSGGSTGDLITITGTGFVGTTGVTVNATSAEFTVLGDASIVIALPTGTAGAVNVIVTNGTGPSTAYSYTRA